MGKESRVKNTLKNVGIGTILQVITLVLSFISRTFFVKLLGNDYLSCDGLFTNILTILSFSELGIGSAIVFNLYKPIEEEDRFQIGKLMNLISTAYKYIAIFVLIVGLTLIPFLNTIISDVPSVKENITIIYVLFLLNSVVSYIFGYKRSFLIACQKNYLILIVQHGINAIRIILQIVLLLVTKNYILYLLILIISTLMTNIITTYITNKRYPWINEYKNNKLSKDERKPIFSNIRSIMQYKFGSVILNGIDNIVISVFLSTAYVGLCSNYNLIINSINIIINQASSGIIASIGSHNINSSKQSKKEVFDLLYFISFWIFGFCTISLAILLTPFISELWLGKDYELNEIVVLCLSFSFFINTINIIPSSFRSASGLFKETRFYPIIASILNIVLSIILAKITGLAGVFIATIISRYLCYTIVDGNLVYRKIFGINSNEFHYIFFKNFIILFVAYFLTNIAVSFLSFNGFIGFIGKSILCILIINIIFFLSYFRTKQFKEVMRIISERLRGLNKYE